MILKNWRGEGEIREKYEVKENGKNGEDRNDE